MTRVPDCPTAPDADTSLTGGGAAAHFAENSMRSSGCLRRTSFVYAFRISAKSVGTTICNEQGGGGSSKSTGGVSACRSGEGGAAWV